MRHPFLRTLAGASAVATDPNFENVTLLLHGDGTNGGQNNTFVDGSTNNFTITRNGNTTQGTFSPYGDNWSNYFDGVDDYLSLTGGALGTSQFCVELWYYPTASLTNAGLYDGRTTNGSSTGILIRHGNNSGSATTIDLLVGATTISKSGLVINSWNHIAICRNASNTTNVFVNGSAATSATISTNLTDTGVRVGAFVSASGSPFAATGYVSNLRVVIGSSVYDPTQSTLTVPTAPLTAITNTSLLTCSTNRFRDVSSNNRTITRNGNVSVQRFSPFSPTAAYAAGTIGGSGYFDGTGDNLLISSATGLCDFAAGQAFTFQVWLYRLGTGSMLFIQGGSNTFQVFVGSSTGGWGYGKAGVADVLTGAGAAPIGAWSHCAICRDTSNRSRIWVNGVSVASSTSDTYSYNTAATYIGSNSASNSSFVQGYLSDMRILKGQALYDPTSSANIDVPTAPLTAITNTSLLLNFQNASIFDNAMMAVPETVGNVQISTSVKKYGTGSLAFDGTGDYLSAPFDNGRVFGTGDFTIEYWINPNAHGGCMIDLRSTETGAGGVAYSDYFAAGGKFGIYISGNTYVSTSTVPTGQWTHIAISRSGTSFRVFFNGVQDGSTVSNSQNLVGGPLKVGINVALAGPFNGYLDDLRITKGVARYTANFTPPTAAFPDL